MEIIRHNTKIDFIGVRKWAYLLSGLIMVASLISLFWQGLNFGIDFAGGTVVQVRFSGPAPVGDIRDALAKIGMGNAVIQEFGGPDEVLIRVGDDANVKEQSKLAQVILDTIRPTAGEKGQVELRRVEYVGPQVGKELTVNGILAVLYSWIAILVYVGWRFEFRYALGAVLALVHDVTVTIGFFSLTQKEFTLVVVAAVLTIIGFSINDTIVIFDRIRDELKSMRNANLGEVINEAVNRTLSRTIITSLTVFLVLLAMYFFGGEVIHDFSLALLIGVVSGSYSTIYVASALVLTLDGLGKKNTSQNKGVDNPATKAVTP
ncbi:MAG: protein translocase subunit SecF [Magnetococcales bacterium]|nr:protein translocase subunit SecF [Magnetococcales bacterium]NGZ27474.1 protein translocase subunit SecF [Magnetococcales bacterium]